MGKRAQSAAAKILAECRECLSQPSPANKKLMANELRKNIAGGTSGNGSSQDHGGQKRGAEVTATRQTYNSIVG